MAGPGAAQSLEKSMEQIRDLLPAALAGGGLALTTDAPTTGVHGDAAVVGDSPLASPGNHGHGFPAGGGFLLVFKTTDEIVNNSSTLQDDDDLSFPIAANEEVLLYGVLHLSSSNVPNMKVNWAVPAGCTLDMMIASNKDAYANMSEAGDKGIATADIDPHAFPFMGIVINGATPGTVQLEWSQNTAEPADTIMKSASHIVHRTLE